MIKIQLSDFSYVDRPKNVKGKALRFTISIRLFTNDSKMLELAWEGNLAFIGQNGLKWSPPITRFSGARERQLHWVNPELYNIVIDALKSKPNILEPLNTAIQELLQKKIVDNAPKVRDFITEVNL